MNKANREGFHFSRALQMIATERPLDEILDHLARAVSEQVGFDFCAVVLPLDAGDSWERVRLAGSYNFPPAYSDHLSRMYGLPGRGLESPTQSAARAHEIRILEDVMTDETFEPWRQLAIDFGYRSLVSVPLVVRGVSIGVLNGYSWQPRAFDEADLTTVRALSDEAAIAIEMATLIERQHAVIGELRDLNVELERQRELEVRAHQIHVRLTEASLAGGGIQEVTDALARIVGQPAFYAAADGEVEIVADRFAAECEALIAIARPALAHPPNGGTPVASAVIEAAAPDEPPAVVGYVRIGTELIGHIVLRSSARSSIELDIRAIEHAAVVLSLERIRSRVARATEERLNADFLHDVVTGRGGGQARQEERARYHGVDPQQHYRLLVVELDGWDRYLRAHQPSEADADRLLQRLLGLVRSAAAATPGCLVSASGDRLTIAAPVLAPARGGDDGGADPGSDVDPAGDDVDLREFERLFEAMTASVKRVAPEVDLHAGLGPLARGLAEFPTSHRGATQALTVLQRIGRPNQLLPAEQLGVIGLLLESSNPDELRRLTTRILGPLLARDAENNGALTDTLFGYLDHGGDLRRTAQAMYVHVNTVKYRLKRIEELSGLSFENPQHMLELTIAQLVHRLAAGGSLSG